MPTLHFYYISNHYLLVPKLHLGTHLTTKLCLGPSQYQAKLGDKERIACRQKPGAGSKLTPPFRLFPLYPFPSSFGTSPTGLAFRAISRVYSRQCWPEKEYFLTQVSRQAQHVGRKSEAHPAISATFF